MFNLARPIRRALLSVGLLVALAASAGAAQAAAGFVTANANLRAGPGTGYPVVATMHAGDAVQIYGCNTGFTWCDITWSNNRGWAAGSYLQMLYQDRRSPVVAFGRILGIPLIGFDVDVYWNTNYHSRTFFSTLPRFHPQGPKPTGNRASGNTPPANNSPLCGISGKPACAVTTPGGDSKPANNPPTGSGGKASGNTGVLCGVSGKPACVVAGSPAKGTLPAIGTSILCGVTGKPACPVAASLHGQTTKTNPARTVARQKPANAKLPTCPVGQHLVGKACVPN